MAGRSFWRMTGAVLAPSAAAATFLRPRLPRDEEQVRPSEARRGLHFAMQRSTMSRCESQLGPHRGSRQQFEALKEFRAKLERGETLIGIGIQLSDPTSTDALADCVDFLWYDMEHIPMSPTELKVHMMVAHGKGCPCMVRVPGPNRVDGIALPWGMFIKHALDANADMVAVPQVRTAAEVRSIVADCRYPHGGFRNAPYDKAQPSTVDMPNRFSRGFGPTIPMNYGRIPMPEYLDAADKNIFVGVMIETQEAMDNLEEIAAVPGFDCLILGANDLSAALGVPYQNEHPKVVEATDRIIAAAKKNGKRIMFSTRNPDMAKKLAAKGVQIHHIGHDVLAAVGFQTKLVAEMKGGPYIPR